MAARGAGTWPWFLWAPCSQGGLAGGWECSIVPKGWTVGRWGVCGGSRLVCAQVPVCWGEVGTTRSLRLKAPSRTP